MAHKSFRNSVEIAEGNSTGLKAAKLIGVVLGGAVFGVAVSTASGLIIKDPTKAWIQDLVLVLVGGLAGGIALWRKMPGLAMGLAAAPTAVAAERTYIRMGWAAKVNAMFAPSTAPAGYPLADNAYTSWNGAGYPILSSAYVNGVGATGTGVFQPVMAR